MEIVAPAKLNLFLEITGKRSDGYHTLETVFQTVSLYDKITFKPQTGKISLECDSKDLPCDERNIAFRAAVMVKRHSGTKFGAKIYLKKNIPMGAGLGGGSSDAAAVLNGLIQFWKLRVSIADLAKMALSLGADVPFFLKGGTASATGVGERLSAIPNVKKSYYILIYPGFPVSTALAYSKLDLAGLTKNQKNNTMKNLLANGTPENLWGTHMFNRLEEAVFPSFPKVEEIKKALTNLGCPSLMSGSGSTVFGLIKNFDEGRRIKAELSGQGRIIHLVESI